MVWPYLPFNEASEHSPACAGEAATNVREVTAAANVALQNQIFMFFSSKIGFSRPEDLGPLVRGAD
jgi:hypothetical protein